MYQDRHRIKNKDYDQKELTLITNGLYHIHGSDWVKSFGLDKLIIIDGDELIENLPTILEDLESKLNLEPFFIKENFVKDPKGFYCYDKNSTKNNHEDPEYFTDCVIDNNVEK